MPTLPPSPHSPTTGTERARLVRLAALASVGTALGLIALKIAAYLITHSTSILASLLDSVLDSFASLFNLWAIHQALRPADREHRFGHGKLEALAGLGQAVFILAGAGLLIWQAIRQLLDPQPLTYSAVGLIVIGLSIVTTFALVRLQKYVIARTDSTAISADALHYRGDLLMNGAVALALVFGSYFDLPYADPVFAIGIAGYIGWSAAQILRTSAHELMDGELPAETRTTIQRLAEADTRVRGIHDLRTRRSGAHVFVEIHVEMDGHLPLRESHEIADGVVARIRAVYPQAEVIVHQDPAGVDETRQNVE